MRAHISTSGSRRWQTAGTCACGGILVRLLICCRGSRSSGSRGQAILGRHLAGRVLHSLATPDLTHDVQPDSCVPGAEGSRPVSTGHAPISTSCSRGSPVAAAISSYRTALLSYGRRLESKTCARAHLSWPGGQYLRWQRLMGPFGVDVQYSGTLSCELL